MLLVILPVSIDKIDDVVAILLFLLEERIVGDFNSDIVVDGRGDLVVSGVCVLEGDEFSFGSRFGILLIGDGGALGRARKRRSLKHCSAFRACDRVSVEIEKSCAAILTLVFIAELWFRHEPTS